MEQAQTLLREVGTEHGCISYQLIRRNVKRINLHVRADGTVYVSASPRTRAEAVDALIRQKSGWIRRAQEKLAARARQKGAPHQYESGEEFFYLGRSLRLVFEPGMSAEAEVAGDLLRLRGATPAQRKRQFLKFWAAECRREFGAILAQLAPRLHGIPTPALRLRNMKRRWGSCLAARAEITLNQRLLQAPRSCIEYVVMHELCHLVQPNHSKQFYALLDACMPDWRARRALLEENALRWCEE